ncbi:uncharacterized protein RHIMIDRAFT_40587 [Rhizopus microsporus ATCC 52813]|uniref:Uncharacterized protein n=1 Tax=Rhizopus microsporus ATCC 52813 TaxID=1340429 RepID=A0A2G4SMD3_RHIZD|nr:uncharacterized protein RHIMIDRAFT_40587 [Rhizopus microsporus ATCC 52813]PHZ09923.1 hypothetical protein RHIMIDRAFT_40587 [Rhizopus microsporus ATCC 52813]
MLFKYEYDELSSCKIGRDQVTEVDDKYLGRWPYQASQNTKRYACKFSQEKPKPSQFDCNSWVLIMGIGMELVLIDVPVGNLICRVSKTDRYEFPQSVDTFALDFIPLLQVV